MMRPWQRWRDRRGSVAMIFALMAVPMVACVGLAVDFGMITMAKSQLEVAADSAALKAITAASTAYLANPASSYIATGQTAGTAFFNAQLGSMMFGTASAPTVTVTASGRVFTATVTAQAVVPTVFAEVLGYNRFTISNSSGSSLTNPAFVAIQILMDTSGSMGILVNTTSDPVTLLSAVKTQVGSHAPTGGNLLVASATYDGIISVNNYNITDSTYPTGYCAFACHNDNTTNGPSGKSNDYYGIAEATGLQLRIDVLRTAVESIIQQVQASSYASYFQFGLYSFADSLTTTFPMGTNLAAAYTAAQNINVTPLVPYCTGSGSPPLCQGSNYASGYGFGFRTGAVPDTAFEVSAASLISSTLTPTPTQDGLTAQTPYRYLFIVTDGLDDYTSTVARNITCCNQFISAVDTTNGTDGGAIAGSSVCDQIKAKGVTILVLYTTYNEIYDAGGVEDGFYATKAAPFTEPQGNSQVTAALQACASPGGNFFQASSPTEIQAAMTQMLSIASAKVGRFTQ